MRARPLEAAAARRRYDSFAQAGSRFAIGHGFDTLSGIRSL
jgi:hypothetical protein